MTIRTGHAPVYVRAMLCEAIEYGDQHTGWWEWFDTDAVKQFPWAEQETQRWSGLDARGRARWFTTHLWNCGDVVPAQYLTLLDLPPGMTYAQVIARLRGDLAEPAGSSASGPHSERLQ